ncbi:MAG: pepA [Dehalococcoidia bacterium]|nr:pepA [Dehalococcoidia bacterium]
MEIKVVTGDIVRIEADAIVVNLFEGVKQPGGATGAVDRALGGVIAQLIEKGEIKGKLHEITVIHTQGKLPALRVAVAGLGKEKEFSLNTVRDVMAEVCRALNCVNAQQIASVVHGAGAGGLQPEKAAQAIVEGAVLGLYSFDKYKKREPDETEIKELLLVELTPGLCPAIEKGSRRGKVLAEATAMARDMVNEPANYMTPSRMAEKAKTVADTYGLECTVLEAEQMRAMGMGALLGVAQGSQQPPKLIILAYKGDESSKKAVGFVGKGITFDSGGISLKEQDGMKDMKTDMSGGAAVIAALSVIAQFKPRLNVTGIVPAVENMPSGSAMRPGDIVKAMNGKSVEIISTDAEGRLILADALSYAVKQGLSPLVDLATLTGACIVALGHVCSGVLTNDREFLSRVMTAGEAAGERMWELPMFEEYKELIKSDVADLKNSGNRTAGAITAAQFLVEFVEGPWVHVDIAGTANLEKEKGYLISGGTGVGVRTLVNLAEALAQT